uniref:Uncharacterized protein n=1 Tax=Oryza barthii TaxID=65489 RepID=A0A0D3GYZ2_9ORYZ
MGNDGSPVVKVGEIATPLPLPTSCLATPLSPPCTCEGFLCRRDSSRLHHHPPAIETHRALANQERVERGGKDRRWIGDIRGTLGVEVVMQYLRRESFGQYSAKFAYFSTLPWSRKLPKISRVEKQGTTPLQVFYMACHPPRLLDS